MSHIYLEASEKNVGLSNFKHLCLSCISHQGLRQPSSPVLSYSQCPIFPFLAMQSTVIVTIKYLLCTLTPLKPDNLDNFSHQHALLTPISQRQRYPLNVGEKGD